MAIFDLPPGVSPPNLSEQIDSHPEIRLLQEPEASEFYKHLPGYLRIDELRYLDGGELLIGAYNSPRASHRVGIYQPDGIGLSRKLPKVLMTGALGTSAKGHNQTVAEEMMQAGFTVILKSTPRYHSPRPRALSLAEDANEMFGLVDAAGSTLDLGNTDEVILYGESQGAMKALGGMAIAANYNREVVDALVVAACFMKKINFRHPHRQATRLLRMGIGVASFVAHSTPEDREHLKGTFNLKDLHHHVSVLPVLMSGETGEFLPHIPRDQKFTKLMFGKDGNSHPHKVKEEIEGQFPNAEVIVLDYYGHVDGIKSKEAKSIRQNILAEVRQSRE